MPCKHFFCTWGCQKEARGNPQDHSGTQNIPDDVSVIGLKPPEHKLAKISKIGAVGTSKSTIYLFIYSFFNVDNYRKSSVYNKK